MRQRTRLVHVPRLLVATLLAAACSDALTPERSVQSLPEQSHTGTGGIALDQENGTLAYGGSFSALPKGFNPTNPHRGSAIVATFLWNGSTSVTRVWDHLTNGTSVGNTYTRVDSVTAGGLTMVTYVATNIQNFPDPNLLSPLPPGCAPPYGAQCYDQDRVLVVEADLSSPVTEAGIMLTAYAGVDTALATAVGDHRSASGSASSTTTASPGALTADSGQLVYATVLGKPPVPYDPRSSAGGSTDSLRADKQWSITTSAGAVTPQWTWFFSPSQPGTWLATGLVLNRIGSSPPPPLPTATRLAFTTQPSSVTAGSAISPAVQVSAQDDAGNTVTSFTGTVTVAIGTNPGGGTLSGTTSVAAVNGVATFSNLSINKAGTGYTLTTASSGLTGATSSAFSVTPGPVSAAQSTVTASPTTITAGSGSSTITVTARDANGNTISGATAVLSATGSGNTLMQPTGPTNASGVANGSLSSTVAETKTVSATINGVTATQTATVTVTASNQPPTANFTFSCGGLSCGFTSTSSDPDGSIASYAWTFGDGGTSTAQNPSHTYAAGGSYSVTLQVTDNQGVTSPPTSKTVTVTAPNQPPTANFTFSCSGLSCSFTSTGSDPDGSIASYRWTFGDGGTSTAQNPSHTYAAGGSYTVTLQVTDNQGAASSTSKTVTVTAPNSAPAVSAGPDDTALTGLFYSFNWSFTDANHNGPWSYTINWGDGSTSTGTVSSEGTFSAGHTYVVILPRSFTVTVTVRDAAGASGSDGKVVSVLLL